MRPHAVVVWRNKLGTVRKMVIRGGGAKGDISERLVSGEESAVYPRPEWATGRGAAGSSLFSSHNSRHFHTLTVSPSRHEVGSGTSVAADFGCAGLNDSRLDSD